MDTTSFTKKPLGNDAVKPALTPPPIEATQATFTKKPRLTGGKTKKRDIPEGLWIQCPTCEAMIFDKELDENLKVCPKCGHHFPISSRERIHSLVETCTFEEMDADHDQRGRVAFQGRVHLQVEARRVSKKHHAQGCGRHRHLQNRPAPRSRSA